MKPILFNTEMVKAILEGRKTTTRRIVKTDLSLLDYDVNDKEYLYLPDEYGEFHHLLEYSPYKIGDILYVRETWADICKVCDKEMCIGCSKKYAYKADGNYSDEDKWKPSIFMPKEAARIFLKVKSVRVEKLQDITEEGCLEEGIRKYTKDGELFKYSVNESMYKWQDMPKEPKEAFKDLWNSTLNKKTGWNYKYENNPYVWVIEFEIISREEAFNE